MASCTSPALVQTSQVKVAACSSICLDLSAQKQIHTPSTVCPTPRSPVSPQLLPPPALDFQLTSSSGDVQPFWWSLTEGDEGPLSFPFDEPLMGEEVIEVRRNKAGAFGSLGLDDWVYGPRGERDPVWDDDMSDCSDEEDASHSPVDSAFESRAPAQIRPSLARVSWADLAEEEEMENEKMVAPAIPRAKPRVNWADLQEDLEDELPWTWS
eukprot:symbB.v1.2.033782.t1/scaffold4246.1/size44322/2